MALASLAVAALSASPEFCSGPLVGVPKHVPFLRLRRSLPGVAFALRRWPSKYKTKIPNEEAVEDSMDDDDDDDDAFEALFKQLEEDLKNDDLSVEDADDEISGEDIAKFEHELAEAIGDVDDTEESAADSLSGSEGPGNGEETNETERPELKNWQLRRLARVIKIGRRKTSIKNLAAELGLDRALVLELLRNPPPKLLFMSDSLPDEAPSKPETKEIEHSPTVDEIDAIENEPLNELPIHVMRMRWSEQKRLKKVQVETLERVYLRTKRPTNMMISSIVQVTNLPRKTIIKWFEDRREQDGVPDHRVPFKRRLSETITS